MAKYEILAMRKTMKSKSHRVVRTHYAVLILLTLIMLLLGRELNLTGVIMGDHKISDSQSEESDGIINPKNVLKQLVMGNFALVSEFTARVYNNLESEKSESEQGSIQGTSNGVLASLVNLVSSGRLLTAVSEELIKVVHSEKVAGILLLLFNLLIGFLVFVFMRNVYSAALRRIYLEARTYEKVPFFDIFHIIIVHKWLKASAAMLLTFFFRMLWWLTIVGGIIKHYSYAAVPYIVAENPSIGAREAITLSRRMMDGHKMELFLFQLTLLPWQILGLVSFGILDILYCAPYTTACGAEFYVKIREQALAKGIATEEQLNDPYLYEKADKILLYETYFDVVDEITQLYENQIHLGSVAAKLSKWFGIWIGNLKKKKQYDELEGRGQRLKSYKLCMDGYSYPHWLNPFWRKKELEKYRSFSFIRSYPVWTLFLLFILFSIVGWVWEVSLHYIQFGEFANRGTLFGPWLPIYGCGGIVVLSLCSRFRSNPALEFFTSIVLCGSIEYFASWYLETTYHQRWWSYDGYFLNLHGRICAEGLLVFGIGCCVVVYLIAPIFDYLLAKIKPRILITFCIILAVLFCSDAVFSTFHPNMSAGAIEQQ